MSGITQAERQKYAEIFQARGQVNGHLSGKVFNRNAKASPTFFRESFVD